MTSEDSQREGIKKLLRLHATTLTYTLTYSSWPNELRATKALNIHVTFSDLRPPFLSWFSRLPIFFLLPFSLHPIFFGRFSLLPKPFLSPHWWPTCDIATGSAWDTAFLLEQKLWATETFAVFTAWREPAKLTRVQLCKLVSGQNVCNFSCQQQLTFS